MLLSVIIVNYNVCHFLAHCLYSVEKALQSWAFEILVVDNGSTDGSEAFLKARFPELIWINRPDNPGFGVACNLALKQARGEYVAFLNPDTLVPENLFSNALSLFGTGRCRSLLGVRMIDGEGAFLAESKRALPTPMVSFFKLTGLSRLFPDSGLFNRYAMGHLSKDQDARVPVLAGAFMMGSRALLHKLGGFDERFFMYGEDIDLSYRACLAAEEECWYAGSLQLLHFKGESTERHTTRYLNHFYQAMHLFVNKHFEGSGARVLRAGLHAAILTRKTLGLLRPVKVPATAPPGQCWTVVGGSAYIQQLQEQFPGRDVRILPAGALEILTRPAQIVWCPEGENSYREAMAFMESHIRAGHSYWWYHPGAGSVIGSAGKEAAGRVILPELKE